MDKMIWFCYGFFSALAVILLGIVGWGASMLMRLMQYVPLGIMIVVGLVLTATLLAVIIKKKI